MANRKSSLVGDAFSKMMENVNALGLREFGSAWHQMSEEKKVAALQDPALQGRMNAAREAESLERLDKRTAAFNEEMRRRRPTNRGLGGLSASGGV